MANNREQVPDDWNGRVLEYLLNMFPERYRPSVLHQYSDPRFNGHNVVCDRVIVSSDGDNMNE